MPGGLLLSSPHATAGGHSGNPYHLREYAPDELRDLLLPLFNVNAIVKRPVATVTVSYVTAMVKPAARGA